MVVHKFLPNSEEEITNYMLKALGLKDVDDLFSDIPPSVRLNRSLNIASPMSEIELEKLVSEKLSKNKSFPEFINFIGGGVSLQHVPSIVDEILSRGEFYTAYTPYQPEISQGMLQALFEYQSQNPASLRGWPSQTVPCMIGAVQLENPGEWHKESREGKKF